MKKKIGIIFVLLLIIIAIVVYNFRIPVKTMEVKFESFDEKIAFKGVYFAQEKVALKNNLYFKKQNYKVGDKYYKGETIISGVTALEPGILLDDVDGLENKFNKNNITKISKKIIDDIISKPNINKGFKTLNNSEFYIYGYITDKITFKKGRIVDLNINGLDYPAIISKVITDKQNTYLLLKFKYDLDYTHLQRGINGYIIKNRYYGIKVPEDAISTVNNKKGIFIKDNEYAKFINIDKFIKFSDGYVISKYTCEKNKLKEYDEIILNTYFIKEGIPVK